MVLPTLPVLSLPLLLPVLLPLPLAPFYVLFLLLFSAFLLPSLVLPLSPVLPVLLASLAHRAKS